jgi:acyl-coenzyme A synthetase/AMP-(fatty) acid ligase
MLVQYGGFYTSGEHKNVINWEEFMKIGSLGGSIIPNGITPAFASINEADEELQRRMAQIKPNRCCTLIYTSGTTGNPKAGIHSITMSIILIIKSSY